MEELLGILQQTAVTVEQVAEAEAEVAKAEQSTAAASKAVEKAVQRCREALNVRMLKQTFYPDRQ